MTNAQLKTAVLERVGEVVSGETPTFYTAAEAQVALNAGQRLFAFLTLCLESTDTLTLSAGTTWYSAMSVFSDWLVPLRVHNESGRKVRPITLTELDALDRGWQNYTGDVIRYTCSGFDLLGVYAKPEAGEDLDVTYARTPAALAADGDIPEIPAEYHPALVEFAIPFLRLKEGAGELSKVLRHFQSFLESAGKCAAYTRQRAIGLGYDKQAPELWRYDVSGLVKLAARAQQPAGVGKG